MKAYKKYFRVLLPLFIAALLVLFFVLRRDNIRLESFRSGTGWGYSVTIQGKPVIYQPFIPAVEGNKPFETRKDALRVGRIVKKKLLKGAEPTVTIEELHKAGISKT